LLVRTSLVFATDWGWWGLAGSSRGIVKVVLAQDNPDDVRRQIGSPGGRASSVVTCGARQIQEYLCGRRQQFSVPVDLEPTSVFVRHILEVCMQIPYGETISYGKLACCVGKEGAGRAAGQALAANPVPVVVPCHRVIRADGRPGGFSGGLEIKRRLLELEGSWPLRLADFA